MIFDLLTSPKVTSLTLGRKFYLHSVLLIILVDLICHMTMFEKKNVLTPWAPQVPPLGHDPGDRMKIPSGAKGRHRHNGLRMDPAQDVTDITCQDTYGLFLMFKLILQNLKVY